MRNAAILLTIFFAFPGMSQADLIHYYRSGDLQLVSGGGGDGPFGLDGAHFVLDASFTLAPYSNFFGFPVLVANSATVTITGASNPLNNATFNLNGGGQSLFFLPARDGAAYLGYTPGGIPLTLFRGDGSTFNIHPNFDALPTSTGLAAAPGVMAQLSDFFPSTPISQDWSDFSATRYHVVNELVSNTAAVPEPSGFLLIATAVGLAAARRFKNRLLHRAAAGS